LIEGLADGAAGGARLLGGAMADDPERRRRVAAGGYIGTAVLTALIGLTGAVWQAAPLRIAAWTARGLRVPARTGLLADLSEPATYGRAYGFERAMDNLGAIAGPLLALLLVVLVGARAAMLLSVVPGLLAAGAILYAIRQIPRPKTRERQPLRLWLRPVLRGRLRRLMLGVAAFELGHAAATLLILRATAVLEPSSGHELAVRLALGLYVGYNAVATVVSVPAGRAGDRWGAPLVLLVGVVAFLLAYLGFALAGGLALLALAFLLAGPASAWSKRRRTQRSLPWRRLTRGALLSACSPQLRASANWWRAVWPGCSGRQSRRRSPSATWPSLPCWLSLGSELPSAREATPDAARQLEVGSFGRPEPERLGIPAETYGA
jgi:MFS family permease